MNASLRDVDSVGSVSPSNGFSKPKACEFGNPTRSEDGN